MVNVRCICKIKYKIIPHLSNPATKNFFGINPTTTILNVYIQQHPLGSGPRQITEVI